jgi:small neutral amino acid transporter SnatA (MarC family)
MMSILTERKPDKRSERRRGIIRTALILAAVVMVIYLTFIGRAVITYFGS